MLACDRCGNVASSRRVRIRISEENDVGTELEGGLLSSFPLDLCKECRSVISDEILEVLHKVRGYDKPSPLPEDDKTPGV